MRVVAVMAAVAATLAVLYARGDWLLLPIGVIFLVGAGWVIVKAAPVFFEQIRLILNVGPTSIWPAVAGAAGWIVAATILSSLLALASDDGPVSQLAQDPSRSSAAVAIAAIALALAALSAAPERSGPR